MTKHRFHTGADAVGAETWRLHPSNGGVGRDSYGEIAPAEATH